MKESNGVNNGLSFLSILQLLIEYFFNYFIDENTKNYIFKLKVVNEMDTSQVFKKGDLITGKNPTLIEELVKKIKFAI